MQYMCLIYDDENTWDTLPEDERNAVFAEYGTFTESIKDSGNYVAGDALQPTSTATTVRIREGKALVTDGPFAETKEQLGRWYRLSSRARLKPSTPSWRLMIARRRRGSRCSWSSSTPSWKSTRRSRRTARRSETRPSGSSSKRMTRTASCGRRRTRRAASTAGGTTPYGATVDDSHRRRLHRALQGVCIGETPRGRN
jgi:hypothetical protein